MNFYLIIDRLGYVNSENLRGVIVYNYLNLFFFFFCWIFVSSSFCKSIESQPSICDQSAHITVLLKKFFLKELQFYTIIITK